MPFTDPACQVAGVGPSCDVGERGERDKENCISQVKARTIVEFASCLATCVEQTPGVTAADTLLLRDFKARVHKSPNSVAQEVLASEQASADAVYERALLLWTYVLSRISSGNAGFVTRYVWTDDPTNTTIALRITAALVMKDFDPDFDSPYLHLQRTASGTTQFFSLGFPSSPPVRDTVALRDDLFGTTYSGLSYKCNTSCKGRCFQALTGAEALRNCHCSRITCHSCLPATAGVRARTPRGGLSDEHRRDSDTVEGSIEDKPAQPPGMPRLTVTGSEYGLPIPEIHGRGLVTGNIIWIGNKRAFASTKRVQQGLTTTKTPVNVTFVDFAAAVSRGPVEGLARLYMGDRLVLNNALGNGTAIVRDNELYGELVDDPRLFSSYPLTIELVSGGMDQKPHRAMDGVGVGYRELSYVLIRNFPLKVVDGSIPPIRAELYGAVEIVDPTTEVVIASAPASAYTTDFLYKDIDTRRIVVGTDVGSETLTATTALQDKRVFDMDRASFYLTKNGFHIYQPAGNTTKRPTVVYDPTSPGTITTFGSVSTSDTAPSTSGLRTFSGDHIAEGTTIIAGRAETVYGIGQGRYISFVYWDQGAKQVRHVASHDVGAGGSVQAVRAARFEYGDNVRTDIYVFWQLAGALYVSTYRLYDDSDGALPNFTATPASVSTNIPSVYWGSVGASVHAVYGDERDSSFLVIMSNGKAFKWRPETNAAAYANMVVGTPPILGLGASSVGDVVWLEAGTVRSLSRATGTITQRSITAPTPVGAQLYEAGENRLSYFAGGFLNRLLLDRLAPVHVPVRHIIELYLRRTLTDELYDVRLPDTLRTDGYNITDFSTTSDILDGLATAYNLIVSDRGGRLDVTQRGAVSEVLIPAGDRLVNDSTVLDEQRWRSDQQYVSSASFTYLSSEDHLASRTQTVLSDVFNTPDNNFVDAGHKMTTEVPVVVSAENATAIATRLLDAAMTEGYTRQLTLGPKYWRLDAGEVIRLVGEAP
jgi:Putative phage tail protein